MQISRSKIELKNALLKWRNSSVDIGLVPTMGALHEGHLSLVKKSMEDNACTVISIFVNPTQFNNAEDLEKYPDDLQKDIDLLSSLSDDLIVFAPTKSEIYNGNISSKSYGFNGLEKVMEGAFRPGHFDGVATIVELLFKAVEPDRAYFGEKDFQQLQIIRKLVAQKEMPLKIIACPIHREANGLARSSRNERLSKTTRETAGIIYETLETAKTKFGTENAENIKDWVIGTFHDNSTFELEYFEITKEEDLCPITNKEHNRKYRAFIAVYADGVRLIDNIALN